MKRTILLLIALSLSLHPSSSICLYAQGWTWQNPLPQGNRLRDVDVVDGQTAIFVGDLGTVMKTFDFGANWTIQPTPAGTGELRAVHFADELSGWIVGENGVILKTSNRSLTWIVQVSGVSVRLNAVFAVNPLLAYAVGLTGTILRTTNGGTNWEIVPTGRTTHLNRVFFVSTHRGWVVGNGGEILSTTDGGDTWVSQGDPQFLELRDVHFADPVSGWAAGDFGTIIHTTDGGNTWAWQTSGTNERLEGIHFDDSTNGWAVGWNGTIIHTSDGGQTWIPQDGTTQALYCVDFFEGVGWISGNALLSTIDGLSWDERLLQVTDADLSEVYFIDTEFGWAGGTSGKIVATTDGGHTWSLQNSGMGSTIESIFFVDREFGWAVGGSLILKTNDGGLTWSPQESGVSSPLRSVRFIDVDTGWISGDDGVILHTSNGGAQWVQQPTGVDWQINAITFENNTLGWAAGYDPVYGGFVLKTLDGGVSWAVTMLTGEFTDINFVNPEVGWVSADGSFIQRTVDGGESWELLSSLPGLWGGLHFVDPHRGWSAGNVGSIMYTSDGGDTWELQTSPTDEQLFDVSFANGNTGWVVGRQGSILRTLTGGSGVLPPDATELLSPPDGAEVYPNPELEWMWAPGWATYTLQVSTSHFFLTHVVNETGIPLAFFQIDSLEVDKAYYWRVSVTDESGTSGWSDVWSFTTRSFVLPADSILAYYPLQTGNLWQYNYHFVTCCGDWHSSYHTREVEGDTVLPTGFEYKIVVSDLGFEEPVRYLRVDTVTANVYEYLESPSPGDYLVDSLLAEIEDGFTNQSLGYYVECEQHTGALVLENPTVIKNFWIRIIHPRDYTLAAGFGLSQYILREEDGCYPCLNSFIWDLVYAQVDGAEYGTFVGVEQSEIDIPSEFSLQQNYPNPFNGVSVFHFSIPKTVDVSLEIYDGLGRRIATVVNEKLSPGSYSRQWNATGFPSGVYFYRLIAGPYVQTRKLVLLR